MVIQSARLGVTPRVELMTIFYICRIWPLFMFVLGLPLWRMDGSVIHQLSCRKPSVHNTHISNTVTFIKFTSCTSITVSPGFGKQNMSKLQLW